MTFEQIRAIVTRRMQQWAGIPEENVEVEPNGDTPFDSAGMAIWARLADIPGLSSTPEVGIGPCVRQAGIVVIQLFVPTYSGTLAITRAVDTLVSHFQFYSAPEGPLDFFEASPQVIGDDGNNWYQVNVRIPYRAY